MTQNAFRWSITPNTEILFMTLIGTSATAIEQNLMNVKEALGDIWTLELSEAAVTMAFEHIIKSVMSGIVLARAFTIHLYLASYLLLIYPVIMEKMRTMLLFWLALCALRSIFINGLAALLGCLVCSTYGHLKPACFEFVAVKAIELACSVYMWTNVHEFYYELKRPRAVPGDTLRHWAGSSSGLQRTATPSSESLSDLLTDSFFDDDSEDFSVGSTSLDSITAQTVIEWFFNHLKGLAETHPLKTSGEVVPKCVARFLDMTPEEVTALQERLKESLRGEGRPSAQHPPPFATHVDSWELVHAYSTEEEDGTRIKSPEAQRPRKSALRTNKKQQKKKCSFLIAKEELEGNKKDSATQTEPLTLEELQVVKEAQMVAAVIENSKISF